MAATTYFFITPPIKNTAWQFWCKLTSQGDNNIFQRTVTMAAGDVIVFRDGVSLGNIDTLPVEVGATGLLRVDLSADEMNGDEMTFVDFHDVAGAEWQDAGFVVMPMEAVIVAQQVDILNDATSFAGANIDQPLSTTESNIRGADSDDLKDISDEIAALVIPTALAIADQILKRGTIHTEDTAEAGSLTELILEGLNSNLAGTTLTIRKSDGTTFSTHPVTVDPAADPITGIS